MATPRYDAYALLLVGESIGERKTELTEKQTEDNVFSLSLIAQTDDVLTEAAESVGWHKLFPDQKPGLMDNLSEGVLKLRERLGIPNPARPAGAAPAAEALTPEQAEHRDPAPPQPAPAGDAAALGRTPAFLSALQRAVAVKPEAKANLLRITFGHSNPAIAAEFVNALARALITRQAELWRQPGAVDFFQLQRRKFEDDVERTSADFAKFVAANSAYSISDQRQLLLKRASDVSGTLAVTRSDIAERMGQRQALADQLKRLKPVAANPFVSNLVDALGGTERDALAPQQGSEPQPRGMERDPPLLLVKVYQDAMAQLLKVNSELAGFNLMADAQQKELKKIDQELAQLTDKEAEFDRLKKAVVIASSNAEAYSKRMVEEQINADIAKAKMAGLRLVQSAFVPTKLAFPNILILGPAALIAALMAAMAVALAIEWRVRRREAAENVEEIEIPEEYRDTAAAAAFAAAAAQARRLHAAGSWREAYYLPHEDRR